MRFFPDVAVVAEGAGNGGRVEDEEAAARVGLGVAAVVLVVPRVVAARVAAHPAEDHEGGDDEEIGDAGLAEDLNFARASVCKCCLFAIPHMTWAERHHVAALTQMELSSV